jgi:putative spermidine/putrescine transport system substrate-binding protein
MFIDDIGVDLAKKEGLIEELPADKIPNMARLYKRFIHSDGHGARVGGGSRLQLETANRSPATRPMGRKPAQALSVTSPKSTQSLYLLIAAMSLETGKPFPRRNT